MFTRVLFTIAKTWKQPSLLMDEWIKKNVVYTHARTHTHTHNGILFHKKEGNPAICKNMNESGEYYAK